MTKVFVAPRSARNSLSSVFEIVEPRIAACPLPSPGRKLQIGAARAAPMKGRIDFSLGSVIFCFGIFTLFFMLITRTLPPKRPVSNGRRGWLRDFRFKTQRPRVPVRKKTSIAGSFLFSRSIKRADAKIKRYGRAFFITEYAFGISIMDGKDIAIRIIVAASPPIPVRRIAS